MEQENKQSFTWSFEEVQYAPLTRQWYIGGALLVGLVAVYAFVTRNILFGVFAVLFYLIVILMQRHRQKITVTIDNSGVTINNKLVSFDEIRSFFIVYQPPQVKTLFIRPRNILRPRIPLYLEEQDPNELRFFLRSFIDEELDQEDEPLSERISRWLKL